MKRLIELYEEIRPPHHGAGDRGSVHSYVQVYEALFAPLRFKGLNIVEIGVWQGHGVITWLDYFPNAAVYAFDIKDNWKFPRPMDRAHLFLDHDATDKQTVDDALSDTGGVDIVIDDGSHSLHDQVASLDVFWPHLRPGGWYIIEDVANADALRYLVRHRPGYLCELDLRGLKGRWDDVMFLFYKEAEE